MTTLIESISQRFASHISGKAMTETVPISVYEWQQILAIIEEHKRESCEPFGHVNQSTIDASKYKRWSEVTCKITKDKQTEYGFTIPIYTSLKPYHTQLIWELVDLLQDDAYAASFRSMAGYRTALIAKAREAVK